MGEDGGTSISPIMEITLWVISFIVIVGVIISFLTTSESVAQEVICRDSVVIRSKAEFTAEAFNTEIAKFERMTPLMCEPQNVGTLEGTREEIKRQIADLSAKCWWMYMEGRAPNIFSLDEQDETGCGVCYYFRIPEGMDAGEVSNVRRISEMTIEDYQEARDEIIRDMGQAGEEIPEEELESEPMIASDGDEKLVREHDILSVPEMYNYLISTSYNPSLLYGGGTNEYIGGIQSFDSDIHIRDAQRIELRDIDQVPRGYLQDFTGLITQETQNKILDLGNNLLQENSLMLVVVADEIDRNDRRDARRVIERLNMNSDDEARDAILITIDVTKGYIRIQAGGDLEAKIFEHELMMILQEFDRIHTPEQLNNQIQRLMENLNEELLTQELRQTGDRIQIPTGTYYDYLSSQQTSPVTIDQIQAGRTYAIVYTSDSDIMSWWDGMMENHAWAIPTAAIVIPTAAIVTTVVVGVLTAGVVPGVIAVVKTTAFVSTVGMTGAAYLTYYEGDRSLANDLRALQGSLDDGIPRNGILIASSLSVDDICDDVN